MTPIDLVLSSRASDWVTYRRLAAVKDAGFRRSVLLEMLGRFGRLPPDEFDVDDDTFKASSSRSADGAGSSLQVGRSSGSYRRRTSPGIEHAAGLPVATWAGCSFA